ncbi:MAG TPA: hypothetical protein VMV49_10955 [Candidatus Deferrimicrobium sp.]|nr:hypothetical protein [Candidatus Deferrimicrobium sp.]
MVREERKLPPNKLQTRNGKIFKDNIMPLGSTVVQHCGQVQLYLRKLSKSHRVARLVDSPSFLLGETVFEITEGGIEDV